MLVLYPAKNYYFCTNQSYIIIIHVNFIILHKIGTDFMDCFRTLLMWRWIRVFCFYLFFPLFYIFTINRWIVFVNGPLTDCSICRCFFNFFVKFKIVNDDDERKYFAFSVKVYLPISKISMGFVQAKNG